MVKSRISHILDNIAEICTRLKRDPSEITLIAVTKYTDIPQMKEAFSAGIINIGENRLQDAKQKFDVLAEGNICFTKHMIGHLQTNKVKSAVQIFDMIQSVDSLKVAQEIDKQSAYLNKKMDILVQINSSGEQQKSGVQINKALALIENISKLENIKILGLMTIGPFVEDKEQIRECFRETKQLLDETRVRFSDNENIDMKYLSMGMSHDYDIALEEGSNMLRIGSAIFN